MNITIARKLDYYVGIPLCAIFSIATIIKNIFSHNKQVSIPPKRIAFMAFSEIGSTILAYQAIEKAKRLYPNAEIYFWTFKENADVLFLLDCVDRRNIILIKSKNIFTTLIDVLKSVQAIKRKKIDTIIDLELFSRFSSILSYLSGAKNKVSFYMYRMEGLYRGSYHTHGVIYNPYLHISRNFISLVDSLGVPQSKEPLLKKPVRNDTNSVPKLMTGGEEQERVLGKLQAVGGRVGNKSKMIMIHIGFYDKLGIRRWPVEYYLELIQKLLKDQDIIIILVGTGLATKDFTYRHERCLDLTGKTSTEELISLLNMSKVLVSHDNGIIHIASLTGVHIVALFGPETPLLYSPLTDNKTILYRNFACSPCLLAYNHRNSMCTENKCVSSITVEEVYEEVIKTAKLHKGVK